MSAPSGCKLTARQLLLLLLLLLPLPPNTLQPVASLLSWCCWLCCHLGY
jgi:hypothetical protein